jgi:hypothetical protein
MRLLFGKILPLGEAIRLEGTILSPENHLCMTFEEKRQRPPGSADVDGLPKSV